MWKTIAVSAARRATYTASKTIATKQVGALSMRLRTLSSMSYGESITVSDDNISWSRADGHTVVANPMKNEYASEYEIAQRYMLML